MEHQVVEWSLPPAPTKEYKIGKRSNGSIGYIGDTRDKQWGGLGQVELDAVKPEKLMRLLQAAIEDIFDPHLYNDLLEIEEDERAIYQAEIKEFVKTL